MKVIEAIRRADIEKPNQYSDEDKYRWLSYLDHTIVNDVLRNYECTEHYHFDGYKMYDDEDTELIIPEPYCEVYVAFLKMKVDELNGETARYNNSAEMYNAHLEDFKKFYNKTHKFRRRRVFNI